MADTIIRWDLHVLPMFRLIDQEHMASFFDLWDYDDVVANIDAIITRTEADMPPAAFGGPWPPEWVDILRRWKDQGFPRLELGTAQSYDARRTGASVRLQATGSYPTQGYVGWLDPQPGPAGERHYRLLWAPPVPPQPGAAQPFQVRERFAADAALTQVHVTDATGTQVVAIT
jgi:hypothetical protein